MLQNLELPLDQFIAFEHRIATSSMAGHHDDVVELLDDKFTAVTFHGYQFTRKSYIEVLQRATKFHSIELGPVSVVHEENHAIVTGLTQVDWERNGIRHTGPVRFTKVWIKRAQGWRLLHLHASDARLSIAWSQATKKPRAEL